MTQSTDLTMTDTSTNLPPATGEHPLAGLPPDLDAQLPALRARLIRHARLALSDPGAAEDLVQDTLIAVIEQGAQRRGDSSLLTWATAILKHKVADWYRSPAHRRMVYVGGPQDEDGESGVEELYSADGAYLDPVPAWQQPENRTEQRQMMNVLERCMTCLPVRTGRVFMMREWMGFETPEICEQLGITAENCRALLHRARTSLRSCMQRDWIGTRGSA